MMMEQSEITISSLAVKNQHSKVNSVQEACAKYFAVHIQLKFEICKSPEKNETKNIRP